MVKTGVLIIGAGPTGLMMACQLTLLQIPFIIVEKDPQSTTESRAIGIQARTLEIFEQMGIIDKFLEQGTPAKGVDFVDEGKVVESMPISGIGEGLTKYPFLLMLEQYKTEKILVDFLTRHKKGILYNTLVESLSQDREATHAKVKLQDGKEEEIIADYIVGADGAHSIVRHALGFELAGKTYKQSLFVLDCTIESPILSKTHISVAVSKSSFAAFFPMPEGHWRIVGEVPPRAYDKDTITFDDVNSDFAKRIQLDITLSNPRWVSLYHAHHRCVATFKKGRCFLVGDAAHIHSPVGAQGMNTGFGDAYNLSWKLAFVYKNLAKPSILDTFDEDRLPFAKKLVATTDKAFSVIIAMGPVGRFFRTKMAPKILKFVLSRKITTNFIFRTVSQIGISYHASSLSHNASFGRFNKGTPVPGDRLPYILYKNNGKEKTIQELVKITHIQLLLFTGKDEGLESIEEIAKEYNCIEITKIPLNGESKMLYKRFGILDKGYYLIRPDMYIGCRSQGLNEHHFQSYLACFLKNNS